MLLFALVGGLYLATGFFVGKDLPSWAWALLLALGIAAWATSLRRSSKDAAPSTAATPSQTSPAAVFAVLGHEIYTPISAVKGFAELLRDAERTGLPAAKRREYAELVHASASHLQALVHEMMDAGRLAAGNLALNESDCDLCEIIELALRRHEAEAESRGVTLLASVAEGVAAQADAQRLLRAISGLVANAIRFSPEGSVINVRMLRPDDAGWVLSVTDTGAGLAAEDVQRIFAAHLERELGWRVEVPEPFSAIDLRSL